MERYEAAILDLTNLQTKRDGLEDMMDKST
jgi:hypothetical protein